MGRAARIGLGTFGILVLLALYPLWLLRSEIEKSKSEDPTVWEEAVAALVADTEARGVPEGAVLFTGSSSIRLWSSLERDMVPLPVIRHGFGGSKLGDLDYYAERLVNRFRPRAIVVFCGSNDLQPGHVKPPEVLLATWRRFVAKVRADLPTAPIYYVGITPSPLRWAIWDDARATNRLIREHAASDPTLHYIETGPDLLGPDGSPDRANYRFDGLHLSEQGYAIWTRIIRGRLLADLGEGS